MKNYTVENVLKALKNKSDITINNTKAGTQIILKRNEKSRIDTGNKTLGKLDFMSKKGYAVIIQND